jgi:hypothetical protein
MSECRHVPETDHFDVGTAGSLGVHADTAEQAVLGLFRTKFHPVFSFDLAAAGGGAKS